MLFRLFRPASQLASRSFSHFSSRTTPCPLAKFRFLQAAFIAEVRSAQTRMNQNNAFSIDLKEADTLKHHLTSSKHIQEMQDLMSQHDDLMATWKGTRRFGK